MATIGDRKLGENRGHAVCLFFLYIKKMSDRSFIPYKKEREKKVKACELGMKADAPRLFFLRSKSAGPPKPNPSV